MNQTRQRSTLLRPLCLLTGFVAMTVFTGCASRPITADLAYFPKGAQAHVVHLKSFNAMDELVQVKSHWTDAIRGGLASPFVRRPAGIAHRNDHLYICDPGINVVHDWNLATGESRVIGGGTEFTFGKPVAVAASEDGTLYVADANRGAVFAITESTAPVSLKPDRDAYRPVALAASGDTLFAADVAAHKIDRFNLATRSYESSFGGVGDEPGKMYFPSGVAVADDGNIFVSDLMNSRVQGLSPDGSPLVAMGQAGDRYGDMAKPRHLAVGPDGVIFIADPEFRRVHLFDTQGRLLMLLGEDEGIGATPMPVGVAIAKRLPEPIAALAPDSFATHYFLFVADSFGDKRISLYAIGVGRESMP